MGVTGEQRTGRRSMTEFPLKGIDHTLVGVRDLEAARALWTRLGFTLTPRGRHIGWGTANYCIMFHEGYIELLGIHDPTLFTNDLDKFLETREGLMGLAFASDDPDATKARLLAAGLHPDGPKDLKRLLELPEGTVVPEFRLLYLPKEETPDLSAFVCCHLTPELVRQDEWMRHPNGALRLLEVTIMSDRPTESSNHYRNLMADWGSSEFPLTFLSRLDCLRAYPGVEGWSIGDPRPVAMTIGVYDARKQEHFFRDAGIEPQMPTPFGFWLWPREANGVILEFRGLR